MKGVNFVKKLPMTKKKVIRNFSENRRELFKIFLSENKFPPNFSPPIFVTHILAPPIFMTSLFMTSLRRCPVLLNANCFELAPPSNYSWPSEQLTQFHNVIILSRTIHCLKFTPIQALKGIPQNPQLTQWEHLIVIRTLLYQ